MAVIQSGDSGEELVVDSSGAARATLYAPDGTPLVSFLRGAGVNLDTNNGGHDVHDVLALGVPGPGGALIAGTSDVPLHVTTDTALEVVGTLNVGNLPTTQAVSGSVAVSNLPTTQPVSGTVAVSNHPTSTQVSNFPATTQVAGSVSVSNLPATQPVSGSVAVSNHPTTIQVSNFPATQPVSGSVAVTNQPTSIAVSNLPATQPVSGTLGADLRVAGAAVGTSNRLPVDTSGTVAVSNLPTTQQVSGSVAVSNHPTTIAVSNLPATQPVSGTVAVSNQPTTIQVSNLPTTQAVSGTVAVSNLPTTQAVSGNLGADLRVGGAAAGASNRVPTDTTGTVAVSNLPSTQTVAGTVAVSNLPATQQVAGTVAVSNQPTALAVNNFPAVQQVGGTVSVGNLPATQQVAGSVSVSNLPSTQQVAGSVNVGNFPTTQTVSGSVSATVVVGSTPAGVSNPLPVAQVDPIAGRAGFVAVIDLVPATTLVDGTTYWAFRNGGTRNCYVRRFDLQQGFTGTAAASRSSYQIVRFTGTPTGGTSVAPAKKVSTSVAPGAAILVAPAGLTTTAATFDTAMIHRVGSANQLTATTTQDVIFTDELVLTPGEGLAIRASGAVVAGSFLVGSLGWYEL